MSCNCSLCSRKGYLLTFVPASAFTLKTPLENIRTYTFNTGRIKHQFCPTCGCSPLGQGADPQGNAMVAINVRCLEDIDLDALTIKKVDGRSL